MNVDFSRSSPNTRVLSDFITDFNLYTCIDLPNANAPYTFMISPMRCMSAVKSPYPVPRTIPPVPSGYYFSCRSYLTHSCSACGRIRMDP